MSDKPKQGVVVGGEGPRPGRLHGLLTKRNGIVMGCIAVILLAAGGSYYYFGRQDTSGTVVLPPSASKAAEGADMPLTAVDVTYAQLGDQALTDKVNFLMGTKQYAEAEKLISMQSDLANSAAKLSLLLMVQSAQNKDADAAETTKKIAALDNLSPGTYRRLAEEYKAAGDKAKAIEYYNKAINKYLNSGNYNEDEIKRLRASIKELQ